jgi:hypothetical protein
MPFGRIAPGRTKEQIGRESAQEQGVGIVDPEAIDALLARAAAAHGEFEATELQGVYDQGWPRWYATYAVEHGLGALVGHPVTIDRLAEFLAISNVEYEKTAPELREPWATYTARRISSEL